MNAEDQYFTQTVRVRGTYAQLNWFVDWMDRTFPSWKAGATLRKEILPIPQIDLD
jgi:hypothetical protein